MAKVFGSPFNFFLGDFKHDKQSFLANKHSKKYHLEDNNNFWLIQDILRLNNAFILYVLSRKSFTEGMLLNKKFLEKIFHTNAHTGIHAVGAYLLFHVLASKKRCPNF